MNDQEIKTLKELAGKIIDRGITGNQDQIVANFIAEKNKGRTKEIVNKKIESALRNFRNTINIVKKERYLKEINHLTSDKVIEGAAADMKELPDLDLVRLPNGFYQAYSKVD